MSVWNGELTGLPKYTTRNEDPVVQTCIYGGILYHVSRACYFYTVPSISKRSCPVAFSTVYSKAIPARPIQKISSPILWIYTEINTSTALEIECLGIHTQRMDSADPFQVRIHDRYRKSSSSIALLSTLCEIVPLARTHNRRTIQYSMKEMINQQVTVQQTLFQARI